MKWLWITLGVVVVIIIIVLIVRYNKNKDDLPVDELPDEIIIEGCGETIPDAGKRGALHYTKEGDQYINHYTTIAGPMKQYIHEEIYRRGYGKYLKWKENPEVYCKKITEAF